MANENTQSVAWGLCRSMRREARANADAAWTAAAEYLADGDMDAAARCAEDARRWEDAVLTAFQDAKHQVRATRTARRAPGPRVW